MNAVNAESDGYRAGFLAGYTDRQTEIDTLEDLADRLYRKAYNDERRIPGDTITRAELEQRRQLTEPPVEVTRAAALASWGITNETPSEADEHGQAHAADADEVPPAPRTNRAGRRRFMSTRTIIGNLATAPEVVQAGRLRIVKLRLLVTRDIRSGAIR